MSRCLLSRPYVGLTMLWVLERTRCNSPWPMKSFWRWLLLGFDKAWVRCWDFVWFCLQFMKNCRNKISNDKKFPSISSVLGHYQTKPDSPKGSWIAMSVCPDAFSMGKQWTILRCTVVYGSCWVVSPEKPWFGESLHSHPLLPCFPQESPRSLLGQDETDMKFAFLVSRQDWS